ncbi:uncharacterized protein LOC131255476 isoform X9 [Magnolia sinica]|uniref:uncharacterized protein LOC131255476 isoform X9 n=1 Tax=Magnolia sinica TaxID=86752 RepID=UPI002658A017|nr:uncharacterized protein LOC131255476 isoform X9 [Magnolia sinica]
MEGTVSPVFSLFSVCPHSNFSLRENSRLPKIPSKSDHTTYQIRAVVSADRNAASRVSPQRAGLSNPPRKTQKLRPEFLPRRAGRFSPARKIQNLNSEVSPHRAVSAVRLLRIDQGGAFADLLNDKGKNSSENEMCYVERTLGFRTRALDDRDIRLVTDIVGGAVRWRRYLDHLILSLCNDENMFRRMEPLLLQILRIGFYEILKLDMPPYAVVDEWMVRRWIKYLGVEEAMRLMIWNNSDPSFSLRANGAKGFTRADLVERLTILKVPHEPSLHMDDFVRIKTGMQVCVKIYNTTKRTFIQAGLLKDGLCSVQDESAAQLCWDLGLLVSIYFLTDQNLTAGLVVSVVDPQPGETIVDCCAAPGGKTLFMASRLRGQGMVYAIDVNKGRLRILEETAKSHNVNDVITVVHADLRIFSEKISKKFDKVLLDAPCSGLGVLSKRADLRWNRRLEDLEQLTNLQDELLDAASLLVKPGGTLVYSTCSIDPEENEERVAAFLLKHPEFTIDLADRYVPPDFVTDKGFFFSNPVKHHLDGSFAARLVQSVDHKMNPG